MRRANHLVRGTNRLKVLRIGIVCLLFSMIAACTPDASQGGLHVRLIADGRERPFIVSQAMSISQFLDKQQIIVGEFDKVYPPSFQQLTDNLIVTIIRVTEKQDCTTQTVPYSTLEEKTTDLQPGDSRVIQPGVNGTQQVCFNLILEDGVEKSRTPGSTTMLTQPVQEVLARGVDTKLIDPVLVNGVVAYISSGQAHIIEGNSITQRIVPTGGNLDGRVFSLSASSHQLLYTRLPNGSNTPADKINELWVLLDTTDPKARPVKLLDDVLYAEWIPGKPNTISYSTGQKDANRIGGYQAFNDLIIVQINPQNGQLLKASKLLSNGPTGLYSWWGTQFKWSPDGKALAWAQADGVGTVDVKTGKLQKLFDFKVYSATLPRNWVWVPSLAWSPSETLLAATVHGVPEGSEPPDASPVFDLAVANGSASSSVTAAATGSAGRAFQISLSGKAGMWARPEFSVLDEAGNGHIAYLRSRDPENSLNSDYDLMIADRDGSNAQAVFPGRDKPGLRPVDDFGSGLAWSPDGQQIVCVYQGNLWVIDANTRTAHQLTLVENAILPQWVR